MNEQEKKSEEVVEKAPLDNAPLDEARDTSPKKPVESATDGAKKDAPATPTKKETKKMLTIQIGGGKKAPRGPMRSVLFFVLAFVAFAWVLSLYNNPLEKPQQVSVSQLAESVKKQEVKTITVVEGSELKIELKDGKKQASQKEASESLPTLLSNYGVSAEQLASSDITVKSASGWKYLLGTLIPILLPAILIIGFFWFMMRQANGANNKAMSFGQSTAKMFDPNASGKKTFKDVAGAAEAKEELSEVVDFLKNPKKYKAIGAKIPTGVLLMGSPGTGKTLLARAVAGEANVPFFHMSGSEFMEMFVGVGASRVRDVFKKAKKAAPAILFIDEIDAVGRQRGAGMGGGNDEREQTLNQILTEMDGFEEEDAVIVIAATNRPDVLDPALLRPGRFDRRVVIDLPDLKDREEILNVHARNKVFTEEVNLKTIAQRTTGFSGADLMSLLNEAAIFAARQDRVKVTMKDCLEAIDKVMMGPQKKDPRTSELEKEKTAYHEGGHALVAYMLKESDPVHKITIIPRGRAGGYTLKLPDDDRKLQTRKNMMADIAVSLGGYAAEVLQYGDVSTGPSNDLEKATSMAHRMMTRFGMSETLGTRTFGTNDDMPFLGREIQHQRDYSEKTAEQIDAEVTGLIRTQYELATQLLREHKAALDALALKLLAVETLEREDFEALMKDTMQALPNSGQNTIA